MRQAVSDILAIQVTCPTDIEVGDVVTISGSKTVVKLAAAGAYNIVGTVSVHENGTAYCTVDTRFRERREDRVSGAVAAVGPFVWDANHKVIEYSDVSHDSAAIAGILLTPATAADQVVETLEY